LNECCLNFGCGNFSLINYLGQFFFCENEIRRKRINNIFSWGLWRKEKKKERFLTTFHSLILNILIRNHMIVVELSNFPLFEYCRVIYNLLGKNSTLDLNTAFPDLPLDLIFKAISYFVAIMDTNYIQNCNWPSNQGLSIYIDHPSTQSTTWASC
jgi:hypothetical protein